MQGEKTGRWQCVIPFALEQSRAATQKQDFSRDLSGGSQTGKDLVGDYPKKGEQMQKP